KFLSQEYLNPPKLTNVNVPLQQIATVEDVLSIIITYLPMKDLFKNFATSCCFFNRIANQRGILSLPLLSTSEFNRLPEHIKLLNIQSFGTIWMSRNSAKFIIRALNELPL